METKEYKLLDGRTIRAKYDRLGMCKISQENLEAFVKEFDAAYRQAEILEKIKENYALMKLDERKKAEWVIVTDGQSKTRIECSNCNYEELGIIGNAQKFADDYLNDVREQCNYCPNCGRKMESKGC